MIEFTLIAGDRDGERSRINGSCDGLPALREAMFAYQQHTEALDIKAVDRHNRRPLASLRFEWMAGSDLIGV